jgi:polar amino acid transport system ATP-binding protein
MQSRRVNDVTPERPVAAESAVLAFVDVHKAYPSVEVLRGVTFEVKRGEVVVLCGPSGSGKSTLLRCIGCLEKIDRGDIVVDGIHLRTVRDPRKVREDIGFVFQQFNLYPHMTVLDNITLAARKVRGLSRAESNKRAMELLTRVGMPEKANAYPSQLSGGQQQRVAIARALAMRPALLLLDEPTSALDPEMTAEVLGVVAELAAGGMTMLVVTHEMAFARQVSQRIVFMEAGCVVYSASPEEFFGPASPARVKDFVGTLELKGVDRSRAARPNMTADD